MTSLEGWSSTIELRPQRPSNVRPSPVAYRLRPAPRPGGPYRRGHAGRRDMCRDGDHVFRHDHEWAGSATMTSIQGMGGTLIGAPALPVAVAIGVTLLEHIT